MQAVQREMMVDSCVEYLLCCLLIKGTASEVFGIVSDTVFRNTVRDNNTVTSEISTSDTGITRQNYDGVQLFLLLTTRLSQNVCFLKIPNSSRKTPNLQNLGVMYMFCVGDGMGLLDDSFRIQKCGGHFESPDERNLNIYKKQKSPERVVGSW